MATHAIRRTTVLLAATALCTVAVAPAAGDERPRRTDREGYDSAAQRSGEAPNLSPSNSLWYLRGKTYRRTVRTWIGKANWRRFDGKPIQIHWRPVDGGAWRLAGKGKQHAGPGKKYARGTIRFTFPKTGDINVRIRARVGKRWRVRTPVRYSTITNGPVAYNPKPIRRVELGDNLALGWKRSYLAHGISWEWEYPELNIRKGLTGDDDYFTYGVRPESADTANRLVFSEAIIHGEDVYGTRVRAMNPLTGRKSWVSFRKDGRRTPHTWAPAISDNGRWVSYGSRDQKIVAGTPSGNKVFVAHLRKKSSKSTYIGEGSDTGISGNGRYVVWVRDHTVLRWDRISGKTVEIATTDGSVGRPSEPHVSDNGRFVSFTRGAPYGPPLATIVTVDAVKGSQTVVSTGRGAVMTDDGRYIAFAGPEHTEYGFSDVSRWDRRTGKVTLVSVGPDGDGTNNPVADVDMSETGRWIVTSFGNYRDPAAPDVTLSDGVIFDLEAANP